MRSIYKHSSDEMTHRDGAAESPKLDHHVIQELAYQLWTLRARPLGTPEVDWYRAEEELKCTVQSAKSVY